MFFTQGLMPLMLSAGLVAGLALSASVSAQDNIIKLDARHNNQDNPARLYLQAGTYQITPVGHAQGGDEVAWSVWSFTNCKGLQGCARTVPTRFTGLHNNYYVVSEQLDEVSVQGKAIPEVSETPRDRMSSYYLINDETRAFEVTQPWVYADAASALAGAQTATFTLKQAGRVAFSLLDNGRIEDNRGGMSLKINKVVAE